MAAGPAHGRADRTAVLLAQPSSRDGGRLSDWPRPTCLRRRYALEQASLLQSLLAVEEQQMARDYDKMDVFSSPIYVVEGSSTATISFTVDVRAATAACPPSTLADAHRRSPLPAHRS